VRAGPMGLASISFFPGGSWAQLGAAGRGHWRPRPGRAGGSWSLGIQPEQLRAYARHGN